MHRLLALLRLAALAAAARSAGAMTEEHRLGEYRKRGYAWPLEEMVPNTTGWRRLLTRRSEQINRVQDREERWNGWTGWAHSAVVVQNYTENGWGLTRAPEHITKRLRERLHKSLKRATVEERVCNSGEGDAGECISVEREITLPTGPGSNREHKNSVIEYDDDASRPILISNDAENAAILEEMKPLFEWWSGVDLVGSTAYGLRAYRNGSSLLMHVDNSNTHVISGIFHVGRSDDAEPWPIVIEDFRGDTNEVFLEPGDILFYESSKCYHGRPHTFVGSYYASIFMHYRPKGYQGERIPDEADFAVPKHWDTPSPPEEGLDELVVVGTNTGECSFKEPNCQHGLCALDETHREHRHLVTWHGPGPKGRIATAGWDPETMTPPKDWKEGEDGGKRDAEEARKVLHEEL